MLPRCLSEHHPYRAELCSLHEISINVVYCGIRWEKVNLKFIDIIFDHGEDPLL